MTLRLVAGFVVWALGFAALYATLSVGCAFAWPGPSLRAALLAIAAAGVGAGTLVLLRPWGRIARLSAAAALVSSVLTFVPVAGLTLCH